MREMEKLSETRTTTDVEGRRVSDVQLFREDVVQSVSHPERIGMVTRVGGDSSDSDSSDSEEENEDENNNNEDRSLSEGSARIVWVDSEETVEKVTDIRVLDRSFMHGDVVALASNPLGQTGIVIDVDMTVDLELLNKEIVRDVDSRRLRRVYCFPFLHLTCPYELCIG
jgi:ubiquitin-conjugating enzyme E2 O